MALGDLAGYARLSRQSPSAQAECDRCGCWWNLDDLTRQMQWAGPTLIWTGFLVCRRCLDIPQDQYRTLILPPDPIPRENPRPSHDVTGIWPIGTIAGPTSPNNQGFTQYVLDSPALGDYPTAKSAVLAQIAGISGIPTPGGLVDRSKTLTANTTVALMGPNPARSYLLIYSPVVPPAALSMGTALWGATTNLMMGPGQAWFWATAQGLTPTYTGALTAIGLTAGMPIFAWEA